MNRVRLSKGGNINYLIDFSAEMGEFFHGHGLNIEEMDFDWVPQEKGSDLDLYILIEDDDVALLFKLTFGI